MKRAYFKQILKMLKNDRQGWTCKQIDKKRRFYHRKSGIIFFMDGLQCPCVMKFSLLQRLRLIPLLFWKVAKKNRNEVKGTLLERAFQKHHFGE